MDIEHFDRLTRLLVRTRRRSVVLGLAGSALTALLVQCGFQSTDAKKRKKKKRKKKKRPSTSACPSGQETCNGQCIPADDCCTDADCGDAVCDNGACVCPPGTRFCQATDTCLPDAECCGCAPNQRCCQVAGQPRCVVLGSDPDHCGACNAPCASGVCINRGCAEVCEEDADCAPDACFRRVGFQQRVCAFTASLPRFCDSVETCAGGGDAACAGDIKEACLEDICGLAQGCGRIAV